VQRWVAFITLDQFHASTPAARRDRGEGGLLYPEPMPIARRGWRWVRRRRWTTTLLYRRPPADLPADAILVRGHAETRSTRSLLIFLSLPAEAGTGRPRLGVNLRFTRMLWIPPIVLVRDAVELEASPRRS
jgi:hypothetical protein